jgi:hypothetical protein
MLPLGCFAALAMTDAVASCPTYFRASSNISLAHPYRLVWCSAITTAAIKRTPLATI